MARKAKATKAHPGPTPATGPQADEEPPVLLPGPAHWLGARNGYSGEDLTSLQVAYDRSEVAKPDPHVDYNEVLELRIHGVGGASAETNLETPTTLMVSGDQKAGFYRAWFPGQGRAETPLREAYCWGKFSYAAVTSAVWLLLLPFALVNLASWALPSPHRDASSELDDRRRVRRFSRVLLRMLGLVFTAAFIITTCFLLVDIVARQGANDHSLPGWLDWYQKPGKLTSGQREAIALGLALLVIAGLRIFSKVTTGKYEDWSPGEKLPPRSGVRLSAPDMWRGSDSVRRQQFCHVFTACAVIIAFAALDFGLASWQRQWGLVVAGLMVVVAASILAAPGCDRLWVGQRNDHANARNDTGLSWALPAKLQLVLEIATWVGSVVVLIFLAWKGLDFHTGGYDVETLLLHAPVVAEFVLLLALAAVLGWQAPWKQADVFVGGFVSVLVSGLAVAVSSIFGGALLLTVTNLLSSPSLDRKTDKANIFVPGVVASGSLAFLATIAAAVGVGCYLAGWHGGLKKALLADTQDQVREEDAAQPTRGENTSQPATGEKPKVDWKPRDIPVRTEYKQLRLPGYGLTYEKAVKKVAGMWATSRMTDLAAVVGAWLAILTLLVLAAAEAGAFWCPDRLADFLGVAQLGSTLTAAATLLFIGFLRSALVSEASRRKFAFFWDVVNFWPRAAHPFAPPCYAERVVPEVTTRIRRFVGDKERGDKDPAAGQVESERGSADNDDCFEPHRPVVLNGYSQGSPISIAVVAQLPMGVGAHVALLTLACPAHRLYGRAFPLYFGPDQLEALLKEKLGGTKAPRWINMCRRSDYVGGPVVVPAVDEWILDPPALWPESNPTRTPAHMHSDWFPDPQTHANVKELGDPLPRFPKPATQNPDQNPDGDRYGDPEAGLEASEQHLRVLEERRAPSRRLLGRVLVPPMRLLLRLLLRLSHRWELRGTRR